MEGSPKGCAVASGFEPAPKGFEFVLGLRKGFVGVSAAETAPKVVADGFPNGFKVPSGFGGLPNGFELEVEGFVVVVVLGFGAKGLKAAGAADPNEAGVTSEACADGVVVVGERCLLEGPGFFSVPVFANLFDLLVYEPLPLPPLPLAIVPFSL